MLKRDEVMRELEKLLTPERLRATIAEIMPEKRRAARAEGIKRFMDYHINGRDIVILNQPRSGYHTHKADRKY